MDTLLYLDDCALDRIGLLVENSHGLATIELDACTLPHAHVADVAFTEFKVCSNALCPLAQK